MVATKKRKKRSLFFFSGDGGDDDDHGRGGEGVATADLEQKRSRWGGEVLIGRKLGGGGDNGR